MNIDQYLSTHLKPGERSLRIVRPHWAAVAPTLVGSGVLLLLDFFLLAWWFRHHGWGAAGFVFFLVLAAILIIRAVFLWRSNIVIVTTDRVINIDQRGLFERHVAEAPFEKIQDIRYSIRGVLPTIFHYGTVVVQTAGADTTMDIPFMANPVELQQQMADLQLQGQKRGTGPLSAADLVAMVDQLKSTLSPEELSALLKRPSTSYGPKKD